MRLVPKLKVFAVVCAVVLSSCVSGCHGEPRRYHRVDENALRSSAVRMILPAYPRQSASSGTEGVAVADLELAEDGSVRNVAVLESPDSEIAREVSAAMKQWKFAVAPPERTGGLAVRGKLTHYFVIEAGNGVVLTPTEESARRARSTRGGV